jgi:hypothetical protein
VWSLTTELTEPKVPEPARVSEKDLEDDHFLKAVWTKEVSSYVTKHEQLKQNMRAVSAVVLGQCSDAMNAKLKAHTEFKERYAKADCVWLLVTIRATMLKFEGHQYIFLGLQDALTAICNHRQGDNNLTTYRAELENLVQAYEMYGGEFGRSAKLMDKIEDLEGSTGLTVSEKSTRKAHDRAVPLKILQGADKRMYGTLWVNMHNNYSLGLKQYPTDLTEAYTMLLNYVPPRNSEPHQ